MTPIDLAHADSGGDAKAAVAWLRANRDALSELPLPGRGRTIDRWQALAEIGRRDLALVRLAEGHVDALAILDELGRPELAAAGCWGVWAAEPDRVRAQRTADGWRLVGEKRWCSGSDSLDHALVTATADDGPRLFAVDTDAVHAVHGSWDPMGMVATASETIELDTVVGTGTGIGGPNAYVERPGFWAGSMGVAACWFGGALGVADLLDRRRGTDGDDPHFAAALGRVRSRLEGAAAGLTVAATWLDGGPREGLDVRRRALSIRLVVEDCVRSVLDDVTVAGGASALAFDAAHSRRVADLMVYVRQLDRRRTEVALGAEPPDAAPW